MDVGYVGFVDNRRILLQVEYATPIPNDASIHRAFTRL
ncbi:hypothetical protein POX_a01503 [Penicillium oxalicum]|nr:hypothetical protein POX_a01503 [Penicillium oxalicum]KAI2794902.1 hypothetical protein POX_a01503 [Penicillium oxalicum]